VKVLVTGGAGYIGSHTCKALSRAGYLPVAYDNLLRGHAWAVKWGPLERGDVRDRARLGDAFRQYKPAAVLHLADLGMGRGFSVRDVIAAAERVTGRKVPFSISPRRRGDPAALVGDATRAGEELGWRPEVTDLDEIIRTAWVWHERERQLAPVEAPNHSERKTQVD